LQVRYTTTVLTVLTCSCCIINIHMSYHLSNFYNLKELQGILIYRHPEWEFEWT
jgi:hypothetical protein